MKNESHTKSRNKRSNTVNIRQQEGRSIRRTRHRSILAWIFLVCFSWITVCSGGTDVQLTAPRYSCGANHCSRSEIKLPRPKTDSRIIALRGARKLRETRPNNNQFTISRGETWRGAGGVDLDRLSYAVAQHETAGCTKGVGPTKNNCHGLRQNGEFITFSSRAASAHSFKLNWLKHYGNRFPTYEDAVKYSGNDRAFYWLENVTKFYSS